MNSEIEAKFLDVDFEDVRDRLKALGAECEQPMRLLRRVCIENTLMIDKQAYLRVRDEGDRTTMTYKQYDKPTVDGAKEIEVTVSRFEDTVELLKRAGLPHGSFQESRRETWRLDQVEIVLDEWPWLKPYIEIEATSIDLVQDTAEKLGFMWDQAVFGSVMAAYSAQYPHLTEKDTIGNIAEVKFDDPLPDLLK